MKSPYTISLPMQIRLCTWRGFRRLKGDMNNFIATVLGNTILAVIIGESSLHFGIRRCLMVGVGSVFYIILAQTLEAFSAVGHYYSYECIFECIRGEFYFSNWDVTVY